MSSDRAEVARRMSHAIADLERRGFHHTGIFRQAAHLLLELPEEVTAYTGAEPELQAVDWCTGCSAPVDQPATGRRRKWCSEACRSRTRRT